MDTIYSYNSGTRALECAWVSSFWITANPSLGRAKITQETKKSLVVSVSWMKKSDFSFSQLYCVASSGSLAVSTLLEADAVSQGKNISSRTSRRIFTLVGFPSFLETEKKHMEQDRSSASACFPRDSPKGALKANLCIREASRSPGKSDHSTPRADRLVIAGEQQWKKRLVYPSRGSRPFFEDILRTTRIAIRGCSNKLGGGVFKNNLHFY